MFPKEFNRGSVPPQHIQHDPKTHLVLSDGCDMRKQSVANLLSPKLWAHKEIL
jgi:hypothetical protein